MNSAIIYARVSTNDGSQDTTNQLLMLRDLAQRDGLTIVQEYIDNASGGTGDRPAFQQMWKDIKTGSVKKDTVLLFFSLDRLSREGALKTLTYLQDLRQNDIAYKSLTEQYLSTLGPFSDAVVAILSVIAKQEKLRISERTTAGLDRAKKLGTRSGKAIGRPKSTAFTDEEARALVNETSWRKAATTLGVSISTLRTRLKPRKPKKVPPVWSEPVNGVLDASGIFQEDPQGTLVIRFDRNTAIPHCLNHKRPLSQCKDMHTHVTSPQQQTTQEVR